MLLAHGRTIYFDDASKAVEHFASINYSCPELSNPADYFMMIMSIESIDRPDIDPNDFAAIAKMDEEIKETYTKRIDDFQKIFEDSKMHDADTLHESIASAKHDVTWVPPGVSWCRQFALLALRNVRN